MSGRLFLVPTPLDLSCGEQTALQSVLPLHAIQTAASLRCWICEDAKSTRAFLVRVREIMPLACDLRDMDFKTLPRAVQKKGDRFAPADIATLLQATLDGQDTGLTSEAGMPAVADPGASVVRAAHALGISVLPLAGPSSILMALACSGLNGQNFAFVGYLPVEGAQREVRIRELETLALKTGQTQLFIETPYRNRALLQALTITLKPTTRLALACGLTLERQWMRSESVANWRKTGSDANPTPALDLPAIFAIGI